jgi:hypothetical protein
VHHLHHLTQSWVFALTVVLRMSFRGEVIGCSAFKATSLCPGTSAAACRLGFRENAFQCLLVGHQHGPAAVGLRAGLVDELGTNCHLTEVRVHELRVCHARTHRQLASVELGVVMPIGSPSAHRSRGVCSHSVADCIIASHAAMKKTNHMFLAICPG